MKKLAGKKRRGDINTVDINEGDVVRQMDQKKLKKASKETAYKWSVSVCVIGYYIADYILRKIIACGVYYIRVFCGVLSACYITVF